MTGAPAFVHDIPVGLAAREADRAAIGNATLRLTGRELNERVGAIAAEIARRGLVAGDRVAIVGENSLPMALAYLAVCRAGAWPVLLNARLTRAEIARVVSHARPRMSLLAVGGSEAAVEHAARAATSGLDSHAGLALAPMLGGAPEPVPDDPARRVAALIYTSGTTGEPKGVMLSHANLLFVARESGAIRKLAPGDRVYGVLPVSHVFGLASVFLGSLLAGAELRLVARFDAAEAADQLARDGITVFQGVPAMYQRLLEVAGRQGGKLTAPALRYLSSGGAPLDPDLRRRVEALFLLPLNNGYGLTETSPTVTTTRRMKLSDPAGGDDSVGPLLPGVGVRITDPASGEDMAHGQVGEIRVSGPGVMLGYYKAEAATAAALGADGWLRTGDLGRIDSLGHLAIAGRLKELIIRSGFNVYPPEVEGVLASHPDVALAAVVGARSGSSEEVVAFVEPRQGATVDTGVLAAFAADRLAPYKRPACIVVLPALPTTSAGKVRKSELVSRAAEAVVARGAPSAVS